MKMSGSCLCGDVHYECSAEPVFSGNCHCKDCQKASGSAYAPTFFVPENNVTVRGAAKFYESIGDSGGKVLRGFCPRCGSQLFDKTEAMPGLLGIRAGTLDDSAQFRPQMDIYVSRAAPWDTLAPGATSFPELPPQAAD